MSAANWPMQDQMTGGSSGEHHLDLKPVDNSEAADALRAAETVYQLAMRQIPHEVEMSQELLTYPEGEGDEVTITERDMAELQPGRFLGNNIVDFYIRFLERRLSREHGNRFYFFKSFFFTKLLQSTASTGIDPCKVDYEHLRKWTKEVNLFAKDYVFIPILKSSHWSLVIICHLSHLTRPAGGTRRSPYVIHLDPIEGQHESFKDLIRSYVLQAWMERFKASSNLDQLLALCQMKYVEAKVPQQDNFHDCGLYVLNYIEAFLKEFSSSDSNFTFSEMGQHFVYPLFVSEVFSKRMHIQNLIHELSDISLKRARKRKAIQEVLESTQNLRSLLFHEGNSKACMETMQTTSPSIFNGLGSEITYVSTHEDAIIDHHQGSTLISKGDNESFDDLQIGHVEYENRSESLSPQQQHVQHDVQTIGTINFNGPVFEAKHVSTHEDSMDVQHQQSRKIPRLDYEPLDGPKLQHDENQRVSKSFLDLLQHPEPKEIPCMDLSEALKEKSKRGKIMTKEETWVLLSCKVEGGRFCKGTRGATHWNLISEEIGKKLGSRPSADQCRLRYDTLLKAYKTYKKYCMKTGKTFSEITKEERLDLKLATSLREEWCTTMDDICGKANNSQKHMKLSSNACNDLHPLSSPDLPVANLPPISQGGSFEDGVVMHAEQALLDSVCATVPVALRNVIPISVLSSFNEDLQSTLLNLVQECSFHWFRTIKNGKVFDLEAVCLRLAILQDREPRDILNYVLKLWELKLVHVVGMVYKKGMDLLHIDLWRGKRGSLELCLYKKISKEVLCKNPQFQTYCDGFPIKQSSLQYIRVLRFDGCEELEHLDLRKFPSLRSLGIWCCSKLNLVTGWEVATSLGSIAISGCSSYHDFPEVQYLFSLREITIVGGEYKPMIPWQFSQFSQCTKLRRLEIMYGMSLLEVADLETLKELKSLEFLSLPNWTFSSIRGLSGLQALSTLKLQCCKSLRRVLELGCLKGLAHLNMCGSSVEDVVGVGELLLLTSLDLSYCILLKELPFLGHLKALVSLDLRGTGVKEILGKEGLISLKDLELDME